MGKWAKQTAPESINTSVRERLEHVFNTLPWLSNENDIKIPSHPSQNGYHQKQVATNANEDVGKKEPWFIAGGSVRLGGYIENQDGGSLKKRLFQQEAAAEKGTWCKTCNLSLIHRMHRTEVGMIPASSPPTSTRWHGTQACMHTHAHIHKQTHKHTHSNTA